MPPPAFWRNCLEAGNCPDVDNDPFIPGVFEPPCPQGVLCPTSLPLGGPFVPLDGGTPEDREQDQGARYYRPEARDREWIWGDWGRQQVAPPDPFYTVPPTLIPGPLEWFNPLGWIARTLRQAVSRFASAGPMPLIDPRDLRTVARYTGTQSAGLPDGFHMLIVNTGGSTGQVLAMRVLNFTGKPVRVPQLPFALQPLNDQSQRRVQEAFDRVSKASPANLPIVGYCLELLKLPPKANRIMRVAPPEVQQKYAQFSRVLRSAERVALADVLNPDSNPAAYTDSIKQWSIWTVQQKFDEKKYGDALVNYTKKNVEAAGRKWEKAMDDAVRKAVPNRWRDIIKVLQGAGIQPSR